MVERVLPIQICSGSLGPCPPHPAVSALSYYAGPRSFAPVSNTCVKEHDRACVYVFQCVLGMSLVTTCMKCHSKDSFFAQWNDKVPENCHSWAKGQPRTPQLARQWATVWQAPWSLLNLWKKHGFWSLFTLWNFPEDWSKMEFCSWSEQSFLHPAWADGQSWEQRPQMRVRTGEMWSECFLKRGYLQIYIRAYRSNGPLAHKQFEFSLYRNQIKPSIP